MKRQRHKKVEGKEEYVFRLNKYHRVLTVLVFFWEGGSTNTSYEGDNQDPNDSGNGGTAAPGTSSGGIVTPATSISSILSRNTNRQ